MADRWRVTVTYDLDGTRSTVLTGWRVSTQLWPPAPGSRTCRSLVQAFDERDELKASFQAAATWCVDRTRLDG